MFSTLPEAYYILTFSDKVGRSVSTGRWILAPVKPTHVVSHSQLFVWGFFIHGTRLKTTTTDSGRHSQRLEQKNLHAKQGGLTKRSKRSIVAPPVSLILFAVETTTPFVPKEEERHDRYVRCVRAWGDGTLLETKPFFTHCFFVHWCGLIIPRFSLGCRRTLSWFVEQRRHVDP